GAWVPADPIRSRSVGEPTRLGRRGPPAPGAVPRRRAPKLRIDPERLRPRCRRPADLARPRPRAGGSARPRPRGRPRRRGAAGAVGPGRRRDGPLRRRRRRGGPGRDRPLCQQSGGAERLPALADPRPPGDPRWAAPERAGLAANPARALARLARRSRLSGRAGGRPPSGL
ncbi:MAG: hypothetical protein AVDCRST_MAG19-3880, partial [uncultured Thermomicrobiales bacterium]